MWRLLLVERRKLFFSFSRYFFYSRTKFEVFPSTLTVDSRFAPRRVACFGLVVDWSKLDHHVKLRIAAKRVSYLILSAASALYEARWSVLLIYLQIHKTQVLDGSTALYVCFTQCTPSTRNYAYFTILLVSWLKWASSFSWDLERSNTVLA